MSKKTKKVDAVADKMARLLGANTPASLSPPPATVSLISDKLAEVRPSEEEAAEIRALQKTYAAATQLLGELEHEYLAKKADILQQINQARSSRDTRLVAVGQALGVDVKGSWQYLVDRAVFAKKG